MEYIGDISPAIPALRRCARHVEDQCQTNTRGAKHGVPDKDKDVAMLLQHYTSNSLHVYTLGRRGYGEHRASDYVTAGMGNLKTKVKAWFKTRTLERSDVEEYEV
jgi:hypothetical protein